MFRSLRKRLKQRSVEQAPAAEVRTDAPELVAEFDYWKDALSHQLAKFGHRLTAVQLDHSLVPELELIRTIQTESKANPYVFLSSGMQACVYYLEEIERAKVDPNSFGRILEFGVGFARILRHFAPFPAELYGCDVTTTVIDWCNTNLSPEAKFLANEFDPPLPYPDGHFDLIYANSVFTHLQHEQSLSWIEELRRITSKDGIVITTHYDINEHLRGYPASKLHAAWRENGHFEWGNETVRENNICYSPEKLKLIWSNGFEVLERRQYPLEQSHLVCRAA